VKSNRAAEPWHKHLQRAVDYAVPDAVKFVARVVRMKAPAELAVLF
jgi:hypothetical protein